MEPTARKNLECLICGDLAKSHHFGALSCDACKEFFKRNAHKAGLEDFCGQGCAITKHLRSDCRSCRMRMCYSVGMKRSLIQSSKGDRQKKQLKLKRFCSSNPDTQELKGLNSFQEVFLHSINTTQVDSVINSGVQFESPMIKILCDTPESKTIKLETNHVSISLRHPSNDVDNDKITMVENPSFHYQKKESEYDQIPELVVTERQKNPTYQNSLSETAVVQLATNSTNIPSDHHLIPNNGGNTFCHMKDVFMRGKVDSMKEIEETYHQIMSDEVGPNRYPNKEDIQIMNDEKIYSKPYPNIENNMTHLQKVNNSGAQISQISEPHSSQCINTEIIHKQRKDHNPDISQFSAAVHNDSDIEAIDFAEIENTPESEDINALITHLFGPESPKILPNKQEFKHYSDSLKSQPDFSTIEDPQLVFHTSKENFHVSNTVENNKLQDQCGLEQINAQLMNYCANVKEISENLIKDVNQQISQNGIQSSISNQSMTPYTCIDDPKEFDTKDEDLFKILQSQLVRDINKIKPTYHHVVGEPTLNCSYASIEHRNLYPITDEIASTDFQASDNLNVNGLSKMHSEKILQIKNNSKTRKLEANGLVTPFFAQNGEELVANVEILISSPLNSEMNHNLGLLRTKLINGHRSISRNPVYSPGSSMDYFSIPILHAMDPHLANTLVSIAKAFKESYNQAVCENFKTFPTIEECFGHMKTPTEQTVQFANKLPIFRTLSTPDRIALLKGASLELILINSMRKCTIAETLCFHVKHISDTDPGKVIVKEVYFPAAICTDKNMLRGMSIFNKVGKVYQKTTQNDKVITMCLMAHILFTQRLNFCYTDDVNIRRYAQRVLEVLENYISVAYERQQVNFKDILSLIPQIMMLGETSRNIIQHVFTSLTAEDIL